jgi:uncharacterized protein (TIGR04255 family)
MSIDLEKVKLPKKIRPCPITESIVEFRFESKFPYDAIFGIIYNQFKNEYTKLEELPILQLPELVRKEDPNLRYKPYYKLQSPGGEFVLHIGARVFSLINVGKYIGWLKFSKKIIDLIEKINNLSIVDIYTRVGIRYINGFDINIFEKINLSINISKNSLKDLDSTTRISIPSNEFINTLRVSNRAKIKKVNSISEGSIIDIDTYIEHPKKDIIDIVEQGHLKEKKLFFTLLKDDFIKNELNPEY